MEQAVAFTIPETHAHSVHNLKMNIIFPVRTNWIMERASIHKSGPNLHTPRHNLFCSFGRFWKWNVAAGRDASKGNKLLYACAAISVLLKNKFIPLSLFSHCLNRNLGFTATVAAPRPPLLHTLYRSKCTQHVYIIGERWSKTRKASRNYFKLRPHQINYLYETKKCKSSSAQQKIIRHHWTQSIGVNESMWGQLIASSLIPKPFWNPEVSHRILNTCFAFFQRPQRAIRKIKRDGLRVTRPRRRCRPNMDFFQQFSKEPVQNLEGFQDTLVN